MTIRLRTIFVGVFILSILIGGFAAADPSIPAVPETQGISISVSAFVNGVFQENQELSWQISTGGLDDVLELPMPAIPGEEWDPPYPGAYLLIRDNLVFDELLGNSPGEVQYSTVHTEDTDANRGTIAYDKQFALDTENKLAGTSNVEADRGIVFTTDDIGQVSSSEFLMLDGVGQFGFSEDQVLCPFVSSITEFTPQFCNIVEMGSDFTLKNGSVTTSATDRFVSASGDFPVTADYTIHVTGIGETPADGFVSAFMQAHTREGAVNVIGEIPFERPEDPQGFGRVILVETSLVSDLEFDEHTMVSGLINEFSKDMHYESGLVR